MKDFFRQAGRSKPLLFLPLLLLSGCNWALMDPQGPIGRAEKSLIFTAVFLMLIVVVPTIILTLVFAWHFRAGNKKAVYRPDFHHSLPIEIIVWVIPCLIVLGLGILTWKTTHALDPYKPLTAEANVKPVEVDVIALDWKWLFVYPDLHIASVNEMAMPVGTPVNFRITSATSSRGSARRFMLWAGCRPSCICWQITPAPIRGCPRTSAAMASPE
jgi:cytochrome o ubiquinol oxidase subunit 2